MSDVLRRWEIAALFFIMPMLIILFDHFTGAAAAVVANLVTWATILTPFTLLLGAFSLFRFQVARAYRRIPGWQYGLAVFVGLFGFLAVAYLFPANYAWMITNIYRAFSISVMSQGCFFMYAAMFRGSRIRSGYAAIMMTVTVIILLTQVPVGGAIWPGLPIVGAWLREVVSTGGMRAVTIGIAIGLIATGIKQILLMERAYLGEVQMEGA